MSFLVRVPATTANLGPGFDCLGLALDLWNEVEVEATGDSLVITIEGEGQNEAAKDQYNAIYRAMQTFAERHHKSLPAGLHLHCRNKIPFGAGLGSSAAAVISGILAAGRLLGISADQKVQLECATLIEGHPDNVSPCLLGGLVAAIQNDREVIARSMDVVPLHLVVIVPDFHFPTKTSRAGLPVSLPRADAIFNIGRVALLTKALATGDLDLLAVAMQDRLHQPHRLPLIPGAVEAFTAAKEAGAAAVVLSGAGPSLLAVLRDQNSASKVSSAIQDAFSKAGVKARVFNPSITLSGATIIEH